MDEVWKDRPEPVNDPIYVHPVVFAGEKWTTKIMALRLQLLETRSDAIIITSLTEIAYLLNLRSNDLAHTPVFKVDLCTKQTHKRNAGCRNIQFSLV